MSSIEAATLMPAADVQSRRDIAGGVILAMFCGLTIFMVVVGAPGNEQMTGALIMLVTMIAKRWFDGSPSSDRKTELLAQSGPVNPDGLNQK